MRDIGGLGDELMDSDSGSDLDAMWRYVGFVSQVNDEKDEAAPNMARGNGC